MLGERYSYIHVCEICAFAVFTVAVSAVVLGAVVQWVQQACSQCRRRESAGSVFADICRRFVAVPVSIESPVLQCSRWCPCLCPDGSCEWCCCAVQRIRNFLHPSIPPFSFSLFFPPLYPPLTTPLSLSSYIALLSLSFISLHGALYSMFQACILGGREIF